MNNLFGNVVNEYYVRRFREKHEERRKRLQQLKSREDAERYVREVRSAIRKCFALDKEERTPLNARITARHKFEHYTLECVIFESRPGYYVPSNLYLPEVQGKKVPGVLLLCGHNEDGKSAERAALFAATLASSGIAVFTPDPVCQGERLQFQGSPDSKIENVHGHNMLGKKMLAYGDFFGAWRAFDAVRSLDYFLSRPEITADKVFAAGCSGGGTLTTWLAALDDRLAGSMPSCYVTSWLCNVENELPVDAEQTPPDLAGTGLEIADFLIASAPRPVHISGEKNDIFDTRGGSEAFEDVRKVYSLLGIAERVSCFFGPRSHGFHPEQRANGYRFLLKQCGIPALKVPEEQVAVPSTADKLAIPGGSVFQLPGNLPAVELLKQRGQAVIARQEHLSRAELEKTIAALLHLPQKIKNPSYRILRAHGMNEICMSRFLLEDQEGIAGVLHFLDELDFYHIPEGEKCLLYLPHWDSEAELPEFAPDNSCGSRFAFDPFGVGEMTPNSCDFYHREFGASYTFDYHFASCSLMLGESYLGKRVAGALEAIELLSSRGYKQITLAGAGQSSVTAAFASFLSGGKVTKTVLIHPLKSYESLLDHATIWPQSIILRDMLKYTDLPRIYQEIHAEIKEYSGDGTLDSVN